MPMKLYSVSRFRTNGNGMHDGTPMLIADSGDINSVGDIKWSEQRPTLESLKEGECTVITLGPHTGAMIEYGTRITRLPDYKQNRVVYDHVAKEHVLVSNGRCVLDHSSPEAFKRSHTTLYDHDWCAYAPSEAIALRVAVSGDGKVTVAWTYRSVNPCDLRPVTEDVERAVKGQFDAVLGRRRSARFVGRI